MENRKALIAQVDPEGLGAELGLAPGDQILSINGHPVQDIIDVRYQLADEYVELEVRKTDGEIQVIEAEKEYDEDLGVVFEAGVFDGIRRCKNKCVFCFVDQMPPDLRHTLYEKDDDYRLSFLHGNFITLTNLTEEDRDRILAMRLSPIYVSVHTTDPDLRVRMLKNPDSAKVMEQLRFFADHGIAMHTQIVCCPGVNDGSHLKKTVEDLVSLRPQVQSIAIVPVGLTRFRENLFPLRAFTPDEALFVCDMVTGWQRSFLRDHGSRLVYASDEFYIQAGMPFPKDEAYEEYPQLENGVGMCRIFIDDWTTALQQGFPAPEQARRVTLVTGVSFAPTLRSLAEKVQAPSLAIEVLPVINRFFGEGVTVAGLLTGRDVIEAIKDKAGEEVYLPGTMFRSGEPVTLDGMTPDDIAVATGANITVVPNDGGELLRLLVR